MNRPEAACWKFGSFRLDTAQSLLFRDGALVPLKLKATEILTVLVERNGQLVEKDELMRRVWPDSFVEEGNITVHIWQLRKVLGEENSDCRIETIPRRGYRFIGKVEREETAEVARTQASAPLKDASEEGSGETAVRSGTGEGVVNEPPILLVPAEETSWRRGLRIWVASGVGLGLVAALLAVGLSTREKNAGVDKENKEVGSATVEERDWIVLGDVANETGEPVFDTTLREAMEIELEQSPFLSLVSEERMQASLRLMGKAPETPLTPELLREVCQRTGGVAVVDGSIAKLGTEYVLGVRATNCRTGDHLGDLQATAASKELVLRAVGDITGQLRAKLGESLSTVQKFDTPIEEATTSSLEALRAYSIGRETMVRKAESSACIPFFQKAIRLDPGFAIAYAALGNAYSNLGETGQAAADIRKAYELSGNVSEHERLYIESHYYQFVKGDLIKASQIYELWAATFPNEEAPRTNLAVIYSDLGKFDRSLELAKEAVRIAPGDGQSYANLVDAYNFLDKPDEANAVASKAMAQNLDSSTLRLYLYDAAFLQHNSAGMEKQTSWASGEPGVEDAFLGDQADYLATTGQLAQARELTERATAAARQAGEKETAASYEVEEAQREAEFGDDAEAKRSAERALALSKDRDTVYGAGLALALAGGVDRALALANKLDKDFDEDTVVQSIYLPTIRGAVAVWQHDAGRAVQTLERARTYEAGVAAALIPAYIRGVAYLDAKDGEKAAIEFQKVIDHPGVVMIEPIGPLARLELGRSWLLAGKTTQAKAAYEDFLGRWKNADGNIPILRAARAEYAQQWPQAAGSH